MVQILDLFMSGLLGNEEAAVLAVFLKGVCLGIAAQRPHDQHAAPLGRLFRGRFSSIKVESCGLREFGGDARVHDEEGEPGALPVGSTESRCATAGVFPLPLGPQQTPDRVLQCGLALRPCSRSLAE